MSILLPNELIQANSLLIEGNHDIVLNILNNFEEKRGHIIQDDLICRLLKCELLFQQGLYEDLLNIAEQAYKDSLVLGTNPLSFDFLIWKARALIYLFKVIDVPNLITRGDELLKKLRQLPPSEYKKREASIAFVKGLFIFWEKRNANLALEHLNHSLALREKFGAKAEIIFSNLQIAKVLVYGKGEFESATKYLKHAIAVAKKINNKYNLAWGLLIMAVLHGYKGELDWCIQTNMQSLKIFKELDNKYMIANVLNNLGDTYKMKGDLDRALEFIQERLTLRSKSGSVREIAVTYDPLIQICVQKGNLEQAQKYLDEMGQLVIKLNERHMNRWYLLDKAIILKKSSIIRKRIKAEEILRQIIEEEEANYELSVHALLNLCELLLAGLEITNMTEILAEVGPLVNQLLEIAEKSHSYWVWGETYLFQAKLALISLNLAEARRFLTQGQNIAEKYGLEFLAKKISHEHDELLSKWENMKESEISLSERIKLAQLNEQIESMAKKRAFRIQESSDEEPVLLLIISEGGMPFFSQSFIEDKSFEDHLFGGFFTTINSFIQEKFSEGLNRASFGKYTLLMNSIPPFLLCYVYKGQSYTAQKHMSLFINKLKSNKKVWKSFENSYRMNKKIKIDDIPELEPLISKIFLEKVIP